MAKSKAVEWEDGAIVIDADGNIAEKCEGFDGWYVMGWFDQSYPESDLEAPLHRLVRVDPDAPDVFRITYSDGSVKHGNRKVLGAVLAMLKRGYPWYKKPVKIERIPSAAPVDVTSEFISS